MGLGVRTRESRSSVRGERVPAWPSLTHTRMHKGWRHEGEGKATAQNVSTDTAGSSPAAAPRRRIMTRPRRLLVLAGWVVVPHPVWRSAKSHRRRPASRMT